MRLARDIRAKALLVETGDEEQTERVSDILGSGWGGWGNTAIWRDWGGRARGVVAWGDGWEWLREDILKH